MVDPHDGSAEEARPPTLDDLLGLCRNLNEAGAKYIVVGGMAVIQHGFVRATEDIDLLVDASAENQQKIRAALEQLPDAAIREMAADDLDRYVVVRVADEFVVDLMKAACGVEYDEAREQIMRVEIKDVVIPFASRELLWRLKQTQREKDVLDRQFLRQLMDGEPEA